MFPEYWTKACESSAFTYLAILLFPEYLFLGDIINSYSEYPACI